ncbi:MAG: tRNA (cytidine(34)-2'-O)-methyltransferase [Rhodospirillales bacterium]|nr:tRNA (cytidine(34)-2'-O)-methyltransferase [Rhodospirillales bacterium]
MRLVLYQPDIPQNTGTLLRTAACLNVPVDIIEPCGFLLDDRRLRRAGMDYLDGVELTRHTSWGAFDEVRGAKRLVLLTVRASVHHTDFAFRPDDWLMAGSESAGVPDDVHDAADARIKVPMAEGVRSFNVAIAAAMVLSEALRQTNGFPAGGV